MFLEWWVRQWRNCIFQTFYMRMCEYNDGPVPWSSNFQSRISRNRLELLSLLCFPLSWLWYSLRITAASLDTFHIEKSELMDCPDRNVNYSPFTTLLYLITTKSLQNYLAIYYQHRSPLILKDDITESKEIELIKIILASGAHRNERRSLRWRGW